MLFTRHRKAFIREGQVISEKSVIKLSSKKEKKKSNQHWFSRVVK